MAITLGDRRRAVYGWWRGIPCDESAWLARSRRIAFRLRSDPDSASRCTLGVRSSCDLARRSESLTMWNSSMSPTMRRGGMGGKPHERPEGRY